MKWMIAKDNNGNLPHNLPIEREMCPELPYSFLLTHTKGMVPQISQW